MNKESASAFEVNTCLKNHELADMRRYITLAELDEIFRSCKNLINRPFPTLVNSWNVMKIVINSYGNHGFD